MKKDIFLKQPRRGKTHEVQLTPHKAEGRNVVMEATGRSMWTIPVILLLAVILTACDPGYNEEIVIRNESNYTVTVIPGTRDCATGSPEYSVENRSYTIAPNAEVVIHTIGGIGGASLEEGIATFQQYYGDSVIIRFPNIEIEPTPQIIYHINDTTGISPFNFKDAHYQYEEKHSTGRFFNGHPMYGKHTFIVTDGHYNAAMEQLER